MNALAPGLPERSPAVVGAVAWALLLVAATAEWLMQLGWASQ